MGGDGGSIPKRSDMVRTAGYKFIRNLGGMGYTPNVQIQCGNERFSRNELRNLRWSRCTISQNPLRRPIVVCKLGNLYNKETVLSRLLEKNLPPQAQHIKSLRDIQELVDVKINSKTGFIVCPISLLDLEGGMKGYCIWSCGCVISQRALENIPEEDRETQNTFSSRRCLVCGKSYTASDLIPLLPDDQQLVEIKKRLAKRVTKEISKIPLKRKKTKTAMSS
ncbi:hypothetical protein IE077_003865 [Cardiosporidium cionae]|uniref:Replication termination factor 2 n=1 Tax=Cardiosporidium cionae TaxID=476202 RepID=A0ABQ7J7A9_9APIC|nr:hypothetical protein IE077_003865 [Cardiosporidium cionae]|eukprot:KAF8819879.1 hypothetical protein IE077_003865 [Cardiosporidium cionae]